MFGFKGLSYRFCPQIVFQSKKVFVETILFNLVEKTMSLYVQPTLASCLFAPYTFNLWMSKGVHDIFVVIVNFISSDWVVKHLLASLR